MFPGRDQSHPFFLSFTSVSFIEENLDQKRSQTLVLVNTLEQSDDLESYKSSSEISCVKYYYLNHYSERLYGWKMTRLHSIKATEYHWLCFRLSKLVGEPVGVCTKMMQHCVSGHSKCKSDQYVNSEINMITFNVFSRTNSHIVVNYRVTLLLLQGVVQCINLQHPPNCHQITLNGQTIRLVQSFHVLPHWGESR